MSVISKLNRCHEKIGVHVQITRIPGDVYLQGMLEGKLTDVSEYLENLSTEMIGQGFWDSSIVISQHYEDIDVQLWGWRWENDNEFAERQRKIVKAQEREQLAVLKQADKLAAAQVEAATREARERELLRVLKDKYEK